MTVPVQNPSISYVGNGATKAFAFPFAILESADLVVLLDGMEQNVGSQYTIDGVGDPLGGTVTFMTAPAAGLSITLYREVSIKRDTDYQDNGDLLADTVNADFDRLWMAIQDGNYGLSRAVRVPRSDVNPNMTLPPARIRANKGLGFDNAGDPVTVDFTIGSVMVPVVRTIDMLRLASKLLTTDVFVQTVDGWLGSYYQDKSGAPATDNGITVIVAVDGGVWRLTDTSSLSVIAAGADAEGDVSTAFKRAYDAAPDGCVIDVPAGNYTVNTDPTVAGPKSVTWNFHPGAVITGTQTTFPAMLTNQGVIPVGPWHISHSAVQATANNGTAAWGVEWIQPAGLNGGGSGIYAGVHLHNGGDKSIGLAANFVATAMPGSSGNVWALECDIGNYAGNVGNQFGISINGLGDYDITFAIKAQRADNSRYLYGIDLQHTRIGLFIENTTGHENSIVAGLIPTRYPKQTVMLGQLQNSDSIVYLQRFTNASPAGFFINAVNANNTGQLFSVDVNGVLFAAGNMRSPFAQLTGAAPAVPAGSLGVGASTASSASAGASSLPANPVGFLSWYLGSTQVKVPYYNA